MQDKHTYIDISTYLLIEKLYRCFTDKEAEAQKGLLSGQVGIWSPDF